ncbi:alpha/beta hydrolase [Cohnella suwonensis]|uniref:Alpha/beta hydrolase n=1 Tax=Cohnella suwonensis TaxID=696072 RepID=A0ABW0LWL2_9BACL
MNMPEQTRKFLHDISGFPALHTMTPEQIRQVVVANLISDDIRLDGTEDFELDGPHGKLTVRIYRPSENQSLPAIVFFHGGGFLFNRMAHYDPMSGKLATATGHAVISVDYRLAPEHKFPVPVDEAIYATQWVFDHAVEIGVDPERIFVAGESVGATLATVVAQQARKNGRPAISHQILLNPLTDWSSDYESKRTYGAGYFLETALLEACAAYYLNDDAERANPLASPILGDVEGVAPALIVTAEYDPLRDEGERYADKLRDNGVDVQLKRYPGMIHTFYAMTDIFEDGHDVYELIRDRLQVNES